MSARFAISGMTGQATQSEDPTWTSYIDPLGMVIDEWGIRQRSTPDPNEQDPLFGEPMYMSVIGYTRRDDQYHKPCYAVALYTVDSELADEVRAFRIPRAISASLLLLEPVEVHTTRQARVVARNLAHNAAHGMVPAHPYTSDDLASWRSSIRVLALAARSDQPTLPPLDVTQSAS